MKFSDNFIIGAATAAHQVEGNNLYSDYWAQEHMDCTSFSEPSGIACDHYNRYEEDIRLLAEAGLNAYRFSIEWARIEPQPGQFDESETEHYRRVLECCRANGVTPIVTMHHFTSPQWLIAGGGWESEATVEKFANYCRYIAEKLGSLMTYVCTINEANIGIQIAAIAKRYAGNAAKNLQIGLNVENPQAERAKKFAEENTRVFGTASPQIFTSPRTAEGDKLVTRAHMAAKAAMKAVCPHLQIGLTLSLHDIQPTAGGEGNAAGEWNDEFTHYLPCIADDDFLGVQNYTRTLVGLDGSLPVPDSAETTQMGYEFYPEALGNVIRAVHKSLKIPLIVTENGIATADDTRRTAFIERALHGVADCIEEGIPVLGYLYWSLLDNFEWQKGYAMTFGLVGVDRETMERRPKPSLAYLGGFMRRESI